MYTKIWKKDIEAVSLKNKIYKIGLQTILSGKLTLILYKKNKQDIVHVPMAGDMKLSLGHEVVIHSAFLNYIRLIDEDHFTLIIEPYRVRVEHGRNRASFYRIDDYAANALVLGTVNSGLCRNWIATHEISVYSKCDFQFLVDNIKPQNHTIDIREVLDTLLSNGLVEAKNRMYWITAKGQETLEQWHGRVGLKVG